MVPPTTLDARRAATIALLREIRDISKGNGVRHSGIALDIGLLLYERQGEGLGVGRIAAITGFSGPTVRLVLGRLMEAGTVAGQVADGRVQAYELTEAGIAGFGRYVEAAWGFAGRAAALSAAGDPAPAPDPRSDPPPPPGRCAGAPPVPAGVE